MSPRQVYDVLKTSLRRISFATVVGKSYDHRKTLTWVCVVNLGKLIVMWQQESNISRPSGAFTISRELRHRGKIVRHLNFYDKCERGLKAMGLRIYEINQRTNGRMIGQNYIVVWWIKKTIQSFSNIIWGRNGFKTSTKWPTCGWSPPISLHHCVKLSNARILTQFLNNSRTS